MPAAQERTILAARPNAKENETTVTPTNAAEAAAASPPRLLPLFGLAALAVVWGLSIPLTKLALRDIPPLTLTALRYGFAAPLFAPFLFRRPLPSRRALLLMAGLGALGVGLGQIAQMLGVQRTSAAVATVISATIPMFVVALAARRLGQPIRASQALGLVVALAGVAVVAAEGPAPTATLTVSAIAGDLLVLLSAICIALYYVHGAEVSARHSVIVMAGWSSIFGAVFLLPFAAAELAVSPVRFTAVGLGVALYLAALVTVAGMWVWLHCLRLLPARIAAASQYAQPLVGVAASAALFDESIGAAFAAGTALVLAGVALTAWSPRR